MPVLGTGAPARGGRLSLLSSPGVSAFVNAVAILFLIANLIQNHVLFHERAIDAHAASNVATDDAPNLRALATTNTNNGEFGPISMSIPRGKAVAMPSVLVSEEEEIQRGQYGGKGDKPHLGGFTEFDVRSRAPGAGRVAAGPGRGSLTLEGALHCHGARFTG